jgi:hypothetical protein
MGLSMTPGFFQHRMEALLRDVLLYFVLVYSDDIFIFSRSTDEHLAPVDQILTRLESSGVSLSVKKCHFGYPSIGLLGHHFSRLFRLCTYSRSRQDVRYPSSMEICP